MDEIDRANQHEQHLRQLALADQRARSKEPAQWIEDGAVWCIDCGTEINKERLNAKPNAARCIDCQSLHELKDHC